ncbi:MAG: zinc-dependent alcohol dehydrogenase family protein [Deltaproteobacteria bacterium]|nr:zinc-dependent alcohol dehydrogenase family protein [Deltaproteobacteria bacterium]
MGRALLIEQPAPIAAAPLRLVERPVPSVGAGALLVEVEVCGVCRTDLHVVEGDLAPRRMVVPGHEVVGRVARCGADVTGFAAGDRVGVAWLHATCGRCRFCLLGRENLCVAPRFTGYDVDGGYADHVVVPAAFAYRLPESVPAATLAPLLCAGIIGYRAYERSRIRKGQRLGLYGFGASAHIVIQIARFHGCAVYVATRGPRHQALARRMGAVWVGDAAATPPEPLDAAILFAPAGDLVLPALAALDRGGTLAIAGIHLSAIPPLDYAAHLFHEREVRSVTANTRADGRALLRLAAEIPLQASVEEFPLEAANAALRRLKDDEIEGAAVLRVAG